MISDGIFPMEIHPQFWIFISCQKGILGCLQAMNDSMKQKPVVIHFNTYNIPFAPYGG